MNRRSLFRALLAAPLAAVGGVKVVGREGPYPTLAAALDALNEDQKRYDDALAAKMLAEPGLSVRFITQFDAAQVKHLNRFDVLYGFRAEP
jgi:hypothetical protein